LAFLHRLRPIVGRIPTFPLSSFLPATQKLSSLSRPPLLLPIQKSFHFRLNYASQPEKVKTDEEEEEGEGEGEDELQMPEYPVLFLRKPVGNAENILSVYYLKKIINFCGTQALIDSTEEVFETPVVQVPLEDVSKFLAVLIGRERVHELTVRFRDEDNNAAITRLKIKRLTETKEDSSKDWRNKFNVSIKTKTAKGEGTKDFNMTDLSLSIDSSEVVLLSEFLKESMARMIGFGLSPQISDLEDGEEGEEGQGDEEDGEGEEGEGNADEGEPDIGFGQSSRRGPST